MRKKTKARALSLLLALVMVLGLLPGTARAAEEDVVLISSASELEDFRDRVNAGEKALCAKLTADIELSDLWAPFHPSSGHVTDAYAGTFDGDGHTISGLNIQDNSANGVGLFGTVNGATIKNLSVNGSVSASGSSFVGGIVGKTGGAVMIENCSFSGSVTSDKTGSAAGAGGIVGRVNAGTVTITGCANRADISGGVSGGILGYCTSKGNKIENCYNTGTISGSDRTGGILGQVSAATEIINCYTAKGVINGFNVNLSNCYDETNPPTDASRLGDAFTTDADGNIILKWQAGAAPVPKDPKITISGPGILYDTNSGPKPDTTLTVRYQDIDTPVPVIWSLEKGAGIVQLETPADADGNNTTQIVKALAPGKATVKAAAGEYAATHEITVFPFVTTVEIDGTVAVGRTVKAKINVLGGEELDYETFPVSVQWKYKNEAADISFTAITGSTAREFTIPEDYEGKYLSFTYRYQNEDKSPGSPSLVNPYGWEKPNPQPPTPSGDIAEALKGYTMYPVWGKDTNVNEMLKKYLADKGLGSFDVSIQSVTQVYGGANIGKNGDITYFYADPNTTPAVRMGSCRVVFALDGQPLEQEIPVILYWDRARVEAAMTSEILDKVSLPSGEVSGELSLPKVVDGKKWALIQWTSDNAAISISEESQSVADTLFAPYAGIVRQGTEARKVTLTAKFTFQLTNDIIGIEKPIVLYKTFSVTVPAMDTAQTETIRRQLLDKLEAGFAEKGLTDAVTGDRLTPDEHGIYTTAHDIQLPTTRDFGVDGRYYPITVTSGSPDVLQAPDVNNAARVEVYRPMEQEAQATFTVALQDKNTSVTASKEFTVRVPALTRTEIDAELALMKEVQEHYFEGIRGDNTSRDNVRTDLSPFYEAYRGADGQLVWVRSSAEKTGQGIVPVPMDGWEELELWRLFKSSNPNVISHEDLKVTRQAEAKAVTVTSLLSSETLGRYGELYDRDNVKYARYAPLAALYQQPVTTDASIQPAGRMTRAAASADTLIVRGTRDPESAVPVVQTLDNVAFSLTGLDGEVWFSASLTGLAETSTVYDILTRALTGLNGYTVRNRGTYIQSISVSGQTLEEKQYGENSGWMYRVNGKIPNTYAGAYFLRSGDQVEVFYTRDASREVDNWSRPSGGNSGSSGGTENRQAVRVERTDGGNTYTVTLPKGSSGPQPVTIPNVTRGQLVTIVHADGREEVVKKSILADGRAIFLLEQDAVIQIVDYANPFGDVSGSAWYSSAVDFVSGRGLFSGVSPDAFAPDLPLSRSMLAAVLCRLEEPDIQAAKPGFTDTDSSAWYAEGIAWAAEAGIVCGYGDGRFGPDDSVTREQLAVMLYRYARLLDMDTGGRDSLSGFSDSGAVSPWAQEALAWAVDAGIITGLSDGTLAPAGTATRAEAAAMLQRLVMALLK